MIMRRALLTLLFLISAYGQAATQQTWQTSFGPQSWLNDSGPNASYTFRQTTPPLPASAAQLRFTFKAQHSAQTVLTHISVCAQDSGTNCKSAPVEVTCGGLPGLTLAAGVGVEFVCDPVAISLNAGDAPLFIFDFSSSGPSGIARISGNLTTYYCIGSSYNQIGIGCSPSSVAATYGVTLVEYQTAPPPPSPVASACAGGTQNHGGRLTLLPGQPEITTDTVANLIAYSPCGSSTVATYDGTTMAPRPFTSGQSDRNGQTLSFVPGSWPPAGSIFDVVEAYNAGTPILALCAWQSGAPPVTDATVSGVTVNGDAETCQTGPSTNVSCAVWGCTLLGSIQIDLATAGQISCLPSRGLNRRCGIWNLANQRDLVMQAGDNWCSAAACAYYPPTGVLQCIFANCGNSIAVLQGRPGGRVDVEVDMNSRIFYNLNTIANQQVGIGWNSTSAFSGSVGNDTFEFDGGQNPVPFYHAVSKHGKFVPQPFQGLGTATALELQQFGANGGEWNVPNSFALISRSKF